MASARPAVELDAWEYVAALRRRWALIVAGLLVVVGTWAVVIINEERMYRASADVLMQWTEAEAALGVAPTGDPARNRMSTALVLAQSTEVVRVAAERFGDPLPDVRLSSDRATDVITVTAVAPSAADAARGANVYAESFVAVRRAAVLDGLLDAMRSLETAIVELQREREGLAADSSPEARARASAITAQVAAYEQEVSELQLRSQLTESAGARIVVRATPPARPFAPQPLRSGAVALFLGLVCGIGGALFVESLDDRIRTRRALTGATGWPVLAVIPRLRTRGATGPQVPALRDPASHAAEAYRSLRTALQFVSLDRPLGVVLVTSAAQGDGKTSVVSNLAVSMAQAGRRVAVIDGDLRRGDLQRAFGKRSGPGVTSVLIGEADVDESLVGVADQERLAILPAGPAPPAPAELLTSPRFAELVRRVRAHADVVLIDSPPALPVADPVIMSRVADGIVVVVNARTRVRDLRRLQETLAHARTPVIGAVLNAASARAMDDYGYGGGYGYGYPTLTEEAEPAQAR